MAAGGAPLSVLHCLWNGNVGGLERAVYQLVREQLREGTIRPGVMFATSGGPYWDRIAALDCPTLSAELPSGRTFSRIGSIAELMHPFDLVHFHAAEPLYMLASLRCPGQLRVFTQRGGLADRYPLTKQLRYAAAGAVLKRRFHGLSGNTAHAASAASQIFGIEASRFAVTYNGLDFDLFQPTRKSAEMRAELGLSPESFVLGTASTLKTWKRVDRLVHALAAVDRPELVLLIVGDGAERPRLEELVDRLGVRSRTVFAGLRGDVANLVQCMDAFCLPSNARESFGNAAVEAMALGIPTVVFADGGGTTEHIEHGRTGFVVEDDAQLHRTLNDLLDDRDLPRSVGEAGRAAVRERYMPAAAASRYQQLYATAAAHGRFVSLVASPVGLRFGLRSGGRAVDRAASKFGRTE